MSFVVRSVAIHGVCYDHAAALLDINMLNCCQSFEVSLMLYRVSGLILSLLMISVAMEKMLEHTEKLFVSSS